MIPYETLGVAPDADAAAIKAAFRSLAQKNHPDKGGDEAAMKTIQAAYDLLSDAERRAHYDETGQTQRDQGPTQRDHAVAALSGLLGQVLDAMIQSGQDENYHDPIPDARRALHETLENGVNTQKKLAKIVVQRRTVQARLRRLSSEGDDLLSQVLEGQIQASQKILDGNEKQFEIWRLMLDILADYEYEKAPEPEAPPRSNLGDEMMRQFQAHIYRTTR